MIRMWVGPGQHCVCYPVEGGRTISFSATVPARQAASESWSALGSTAELASAYRGWNPVVARLLAAAEVVGRWDLHDRDPIPRWTTARVTLVGDAAHPMLPFMAQGGNQAIEDAVALGTCLAALGTDAVAIALRVYEALRAPRTALIQRGSRLGPAAITRLGGDAGPVQDGLQRLHAMEWLYGHDSGQAARPRQHDARHTGQLKRDPSAAAASSAPVLTSLWSPQSSVRWPRTPPRHQLPSAGRQLPSAGTATPLRRTTP